MTGIPLPERVVRRRNARNVRAGVEPYRTNAWRAQLAKVSSCEGDNYDGGKGLVTDFEFSDEQPNRRCVLECEGNSQKLVMELYELMQHQDPNALTLFEIALPNEEDLLDLRIYESTRSLELRLTPKGEALTKREPRKIWSLQFRTEQQHLSGAKAMVKRLENVTSEMPEDWFSYRNYSSSSTRERALEGSEFVPRLFSQPITGGHVWNFTGFFATLEFQRALGRVTADPAEKDSDPTTTLKTKTRYQVKAEKRQKKLDRRRQARQKAAGQLPDDEPVVEDNDSSQSPEDLSGTRSHEQATATAGSSRSKEVSYTRSNKQATAAAGSSRSTPSVTSQEYEIEKILDIRVGETSQRTEFLVQWVGYEEPTWEPASLIPPSSIEDFYRERFGGHTGTKRKR